MRGRTGREERGGERLQDSKLHTARKRRTKEEGRGNESEGDGEELKRVDIQSATYCSSDIF